MVLITFNWNFPSVKMAHEFGHESFNKMLVINLLFMTIFISKSSGMLGKMMYTYVNTKGGVESIPQYREQIKKIKSKPEFKQEKMLKAQWLVLSRIETDSIKIILS